MTAQSLCEWLDAEYHNRLVELIRLTENTQREHGFSVVGYPDAHEATKTLSGSERSIDIVTQTTTAFRPTRIGVHTHPSGSTAFSDADWRSFLTEYAQYRPDAEWPAGWHRGQVVLARRAGEDDKFGMKALVLNDSATGLSSREQRDWVQDGFAALDTTVGMLGTSSDIADEIGPEVSVCRTTVAETTQ